MNFFLFKEYLSHWLLRVGPHSLHSPFIFDFYKEVVRDQGSPKKTKSIENIRKRLLKDSSKIQTQSFGASSSINQNPIRTISNIASGGISGLNVSSFLFRLGSWIQSEQVLELGTSLGINTLYLAQIPNSKVITFDGCTESIEIARQNFDEMRANNITIVSGNIDSTLDPQLQRIEKLDLVFFDANHRLEPTLNYYEQCKKKIHKNSVFVFDDIHWSREMKEAWTTIVSDGEVTVSVDLFNLGVVFFNPELEKTHFCLEY